MKPTYRKSWAVNLLMFSDSTLHPSFKVKQWFTGFGELSFQWIQICIGSLMRRSSLFGALRRFQQCTGHITMDSLEGRGNQYIQLVKVLYCKLPTNGK